MGGDLSLLSANLFAEGSIGKKWTFLVAGRKSYKGPFYNKIFNQFNNTRAVEANPVEMGAAVVALVVEADKAHQAILFLLFFMM